MRKQTWGLGTRLGLLGLLAAVFPPEPARATEPAAPNCTIFVRTVDHGGRFEKQVLYTRMESREECRTLARMHVPIFSSRVRRKKVTFRFGAVPEQRANFPGFSQHSSRAPQGRSRRL